MPLRHGSSGPASSVLRSRDTRVVLRAGRYRRSTPLPALPLLLRLPLAGLSVSSMRTDCGRGCSEGGCHSRRSSTRGPGGTEGAGCTGDDGGGWDSGGSCGGHAPPGASSSASDGDSSSARLWRSRSGGTLDRDGIGHGSGGRARRRPGVSIPTAGAPTRLSRSPSGSLTRGGSVDGDRQSGCSPVRHLAVLSAGSRARCLPYGLGTGTV